MFSPQKMFRANPSSHSKSHTKNPWRLYHLLWLIVSLNDCRKDKTLLSWLALPAVQVCNLSWISWPRVCIHTVDQQIPALSKQLIISFANYSIVYNLHNPRKILTPQNDAWNPEQSHKSVYWYPNIDRQLNICKTLHLNPEGQIFIESFWEYHCGLPNLGLQTLHFSHQ